MRYAVWAGAGLLLFAVLEAIAAALHCDPVDLIGRPPSLARRDELVSLVDGLPTEKRHEALSILRILAGAVPAE